MPNSPSSSPGCGCTLRQDWSTVEDDSVMRWPTLDVADWEELRQCPDCGSVWLVVWTEETESPPILCRPEPSQARRLREVDRVATMRPYCLAKLAEHLGEIREQKLACRKLRCCGNVPISGRQKKREKGVIPSRVAEIIPAATYSPTEFPLQYHGPWRT